MFKTCVIKNQGSAMISYTLHFYLIELIEKKIQMRRVKE